METLEETKTSTNEKSKNKNYTWWKHGIIYHIYPRSFYDTNNDGIGDLQGICAKLDYLKELNIDAIWLSPVYESPQIDFGYDVSDYRKIDPIFGTLDDFKALLKSAHKKNIKVVIDMILNHTSNQHPWFIDSKSDINSKKRDWYIWEKGINGNPPNNWKTTLGKSAWEFDETTGEYYYHSFLKEQPDLNWRNTEVKKAMFNEIRFWLDLGVDGIRLDVINLIIKDKKLRNNPNLFGRLFSKKTLYNRNREKSIKIVKELRLLLDSYKDKMSVGEILALPPGEPHQVGRYIDKGKNALHMAFDFSLIFTPWSAKKYAQSLQNIYRFLPKKGWPCIVLSNHDLNRKSPLAISEATRIAKAKLMATMMFTLHGTPFIYYGEEIGMGNTPIPRKHIKDPMGKYYWPFYSGRDKCRTPMQWNSDDHAGFSTTYPWLPVNKNFTTLNVQSLKEDDASILLLYKELINLRKQEPALYKGKWELCKCDNKNILAYKRKYKKDEILVLLNFSFLKQEVRIPYKHKVLFSSHMQPDEIMVTVMMQPYEGVVLKNEVVNSIL